MKKIYFLASVLLATFTIQAQTTVDFEELELEENTLWDGSDQTGEFTSKGATFENSFYSDEDWEGWIGGFAYSNMTDNETAGFTNQGSAYPASGADESSNYAVFNTYGTITFEEAVDLTSIDLTNTTYTYISMRDGDGFGKKFGEDGDEDFFYVDIYGINDEDTIATARFYLADFTSEDENDHYILDSWETVDLSELKGITSISFGLNSSDVGEYGMNTPAFFALDNLIYDEATSSLAVEELAQFSIFPNPANNIVNIEGENGEYAIVNMNGQTVITFQNIGLTTVNVSSLDAGIYFIKNTSLASKTMKLIIQ